MRHTTCIHTCKGDGFTYAKRHTHMHAHGGCPHMARMLGALRLHTLIPSCLCRIGSELARHLRFLGPRSWVPSVQTAAMADRDVAWSALESLFGSQVRGPGSQTYQIKIVRICGLSDRLTGLPESTYVFHCLRAALLWLQFYSTCCIVHRLSL